MSASTTLPSTPNSARGRPTSVCVPLAITDWQAAPDATQQGEAVAAIERGDVLLFPRLPFVLTAEEARLLRPDSVKDGSKTIKFDPGSGRAWGMASEGDAAALKSMMSRYAQATRALLDALIPSYGAALKIGNTSFRPVERKDGRSRSGTTTRCSMSTPFRRGRATASASCASSPTCIPATRRASGAWVSPSRRWRSASCQRFRRLSGQRSADADGRYHQGTTQRRRPLHAPDARPHEARRRLPAHRAPPGRRVPAGRDLDRLHRPGVACRHVGPARAGADYTLAVEAMATPEQAPCGCWSSSRARSCIEGHRVWVYRKFGGAGRVRCRQRQRRRSPASPAIRR